MAKEAIVEKVSQLTYDDVKDLDASLAEKHQFVFEASDDKKSLRILNLYTEEFDDSQVLLAVHNGQEKNAMPICYLSGKVKPASIIEVSVPVEDYLSKSFTIEKVKYCIVNMPAIEYDEEHSFYFTEKDRISAEKEKEESVETKTEENDKPAKSKKESGKALHIGMLIGAFVCIVGVIVVVSLIFS